jgi:hypothetical protein
MITKYMLYIDKEYVFYYPSVKWHSDKVDRASHRGTYRPII